MCVRFPDWFWSQCLETCAVCLWRPCRLLISWFISARYAVAKRPPHYISTHNFHRLIANFLFFFSHSFRLHFNWKRRRKQEKKKHTKMGKFSGKKCRLLSVMNLTIFFFFVEIIVGYVTNSMALVADSFHMLGDIAALLISFLSIKVSDTFSVHFTDPMWFGSGSKFYAIRLESYFDFELDAWISLRICQ